MGSGLKDRRHARFTLVELMVVIAIVMVLAAIAVPSFYTMQLRAKRAEVPVNTDGIMTAVIAYDAQYDAIVAPGGWVPGGDPGKAASAWPASYFDTIGWEPDGDVRGQYTLSAGKYLHNCAPDLVVTLGVYVVGQCDVDGDDVDACWQGAYDPLSDPALEPVQHISDLDRY